MAVLFVNPFWVHEGAGDLWSTEQIGDARSQLTVCGLDGDEAELIDVDELSLLAAAQHCERQPHEGPETACEHGEDQVQAMVRMRADDYRLKVTLSFDASAERPPGATSIWSVRANSSAS